MDKKIVTVAVSISRIIPNIVVPVEKPAQKVCVVLRAHVSSHAPPIPPTPVTGAVSISKTTTFTVVLVGTLVPADFAVMVGSVSVLTGFCCVVVSVSTRRSIVFTVVGAIKPVKITKTVPRTPV